MRKIILKNETPSISAPNGFTFLYSDESGNISKRELSVDGEVGASSFDSGVFTLTAANSATVNGGSAFNPPIGFANDTSFAGLRIPTTKRMKRVTIKTWSTSNNLNHSDGIYTANDDEHQNCTYQTRVDLSATENRIDTYVCLYVVDNSSLNNPKPGFRGHIYTTPSTIGGTLVGNGVTDTYFDIIIATLGPNGFGLDIEGQYHIEY